MNTFGEALRDLRRASGLSQRQVAERAGLDFSYISKLENGRLPAPAADTISRISGVIGCPAEVLLSAARKMPSGVGNALAAEPAALRFLERVSKLNLSETEWENLTGHLHKLRPDAQERDQ